MEVLGSSLNHTDREEFFNVCVLEFGDISLVNSYAWIFIVIFFYQNMAKLKCMDYGFECDFIAEGEIEDVIENFRTHTDEEHGIEYSKETLMQFLLRKQGL